jgi:hypothetical protein
LIDEVTAPAPAGAPLGFDVFEVTLVAFCTVAVLV